MTPAQLANVLKDDALAQRVHDSLARFPAFELGVYSKPLSRALLEIELSIAKNFTWDAQLHKSALQLWIFVLDVDGEALLHLAAPESGFPTL